MKKRLILPITIRRLFFSFLETIDGINFGFARMYVTPYLIYKVKST